MLLKSTAIIWFYGKHISNEQVYLKNILFKFYHKMMVLFVVGYELSAFNRFYVLQTSISF